MKSKPTWRGNYRIQVFAYPGGHPGHADSQEGLAVYIHILGRRETEKAPKSLKLTVTVANRKKLGNSIEASLTELIDEEGWLYVSAHFAGREEMTGSVLCDIIDHQGVAIFATHRRHSAATNMNQPLSDSSMTDQSKTEHPPPAELEEGIRSGSDEKVLAGAGVLAADAPAKRYCCGKLSRKQFIWLWIIIVILMILIIVAVLLILFVGGRAMAQSGLNSSVVNLNELAIRDPVECGGNDASAALCLDSTMKISVKSDSMSSTILPSRNDIYINGKQLGYVYLPRMDVAGHATTQFTNDATLYVTDRAVFDGFGVDVMLKDTVSLNMKGKMDVKGLGITFKGLNFDKSVSISGFNNFTKVMGKSTTSIQFFPPDAELKKKYWTDVPGVIQAQFGYSGVEVPNPTVITIPHVGNVTGDLYYKNTPVGVSVAVNGTSLIAKSMSYVKNMVVIQIRNETLNIVNEMAGKLLSGQEVILLLHGTSTSNSIWTNAVKSMYMPTNATPPASS
ncbi:hypothetical protein FOZ61_007826 [Perkinsus olseni]|uniref:Uncharacterized protein n=2 Tax=Perkinsus olseni TaxID=32597 RepID=A0A7J6L794_PEROL|nr:hypothetical protein FOZ61_007826 [Perkinsus olseni]